MSKSVSYTKQFEKTNIVDFAKYCKEADDTTRAWKFDIANAAIKIGGALNNLKKYAKANDIQWKEYIKNNLSDYKHTTHSVYMRIARKQALHAYPFLGVEVLGKVASVLKKKTTLQQFLKDTGCNDEVLAGDDKDAIKREIQLALLVSKVKKNGNITIPRVVAEYIFEKRPRVPKTFISELADFLRNENGTGLTQELKDFIEGYTAGRVNTEYDQALSKLRRYIRSVGSLPSYLMQEINRLPESAANGQVEDLNQEADNLPPIVDDRILGQAPSNDYEPVVAEG